MIERDFDIIFCDNCQTKFEPKGFTLWKELFPICPKCNCYTDFTYVDPSGGLHGGGVGMDPDGEFCGECSYTDCTFCSVWLNKIEKRKENA